MAIRLVPSQTELEIVRRRYSSPSSLKESPDGFLGDAVKQRPRFDQQIKLAFDSSVAFLEIFGTSKPARPRRIRPGDKPDRFLENRFFTRDNQRPLVHETELFLSLYEEITQDRMVQVRRAHHKSPATATHTDCHVSRWNIRRHTTASRR